MPGGSPEAYDLISPIFSAVAAKVNGSPCVTFIGKGSAGNYVKMVHNGIEYGLMQLIAETYAILREGFGLTNQQIQSVFHQWNRGKLQSYLIEITAEIFKHHDDITGQLLIDVILDKAQQKGTGKWTSQNAMDLGIAIPTIDAALSMRAISANKNERLALSESFPKNHGHHQWDDLWRNKIEDALYCAFIITYTQGFLQIAAANERYQYEVNFYEIARIWQGGCIIRANLLSDIMECFQVDNQQPDLFHHKKMAAHLSEFHEALRESIVLAIGREIPVLAFSSALGFFDASKTARLPLNLVQAQRDYFGSHTYERTDRDGIFHTEWQ